jgi:hypothetical protein
MCVDDHDAQEQTAQLSRLLTEQPEPSDDDLAILFELLAAVLAIQDEEIAKLEEEAREARMKREQREKEIDRAAELVAAANASLDREIAELQENATTWRLAAVVTQRIVEYLNIDPEQ